MQLKRKSVFFLLEDIRDWKTKRFYNIFLISLETMPTAKVSPQAIKMLLGSCSLVELTQVPNSSASLCRASVVNRLSL